MSSFDYVHCDYPLPFEPKDRLFQTKSFQNQFESYTICADGTIIRHDDRSTWGPQHDSDPEKFVPHDSPLPLNRDIEFYSRDAWFAATFKDGVIANVRTVWRNEP